MQISLLLLGRIGPSWPGGVSLALRKKRVSDLMARDGVVAQDQKDLLKLNHACAARALFPRRQRPCLSLLLTRLP